MLPYLIAPICVCIAILTSLALCRVRVQRLTEEMNATDSASRAEKRLEEETEIEEWLASVSHPAYLKRMRGIDDWHQRNRQRRQ
jgi:hypothetical protein